MTDRDKVLEWEAHIENMLHVLQERLDEFSDGKDLSDFEQEFYLMFLRLCIIAELSAKCLYLLSIQQRRGSNVCLLLVH